MADIKREYFTHDEIHQRPNQRYFTEDRHQIHYHFRPARPANFCITRDPVSGEINVSAGTIGPLTWHPYTMCLHISIQGSRHTYDNLLANRQCVIGLPGKDIVDETWFTALPLPRGIEEATVAGLHYCPSKHIDIPGILECPVNFECVVEHHVDYHTHGIFFIRVLGANIDDRVLSMKREEVVHWFPTYEVDDITNEFGGSVERLGVMGDLFPCPAYPRASKSGWYQSYEVWMKDLCDGGYLMAAECERAIQRKHEYDSLFADLSNPRRAELKQNITELAAALVQLDWNKVHELLA